MAADATAMRETLKAIDASGTQYPRKQDQRALWKELTDSNALPDLRKKPKGRFYDAAQLRCAVSYVVRGNKKPEYHLVVGQNAMDLLFQRGSDMLKRNYLASIGYPHVSTTLSGNSVASDDIIDNATLEKATSRPMKRRASDLAKDLLLTGYDRAVPSTPEDSGRASKKFRKLTTDEMINQKPRAFTGPQRGPNVAEVIDEHVSSTNIITSNRLSSGSHPKPTSDPKFLEGALKDTIFEPVKVVHSTPARSTVRTWSDSEIRDEFKQIRTMVKQAISQMNIQNQHFLHQLLRLSSSSNTSTSSTALAALMQSTLGTIAWQPMIQNLLAANTFNASTLIQGLIWAFLDIEIFQRDLPAKQESPPSPSSLLTSSASFGHDHDHNHIKDNASTNPRPPDSLSQRLLQALSPLLDLPSCAESLKAQHQLSPHLLHHACQRASILHANMQKATVDPPETETPTTMKRKSYRLFRPVGGQRAYVSNRTKAAPEAGLASLTERRSGSSSRRVKGEGERGRGRVEEERIVVTREPGVVVWERGGEGDGIREREREKVLVRAVVIVTGDVGMGDGWRDGG